MEYDNVDAFISYYRDRQRDLDAKLFQYEGQYAPHVQMPLKETVEPHVSRFVNLPRKIVGKRYEYNFKTIHGEIAKNNSEVGTNESSTFKNSESINHTKEEHGEQNISNEEAKLPSVSPMDDNHDQGVHNQDRIHETPRHIDQTTSHSFGADAKRYSNQTSLEPASLRNIPVSPITTKPAHHSGSPLVNRSTTSTNLNNMSNVSNLNSSRYMEHRSFMQEEEKEGEAKHDLHTSFHETHGQPMSTLVNHFSQPSSVQFKVEDNAIHEAIDTTHTEAVVPACVLPKHYSPHEVGAIPTAMSVICSHIFLTGSLQSISLSYPSRSEFFRQHEHNINEMTHGQQLMLGGPRDGIESSLLTHAPRASHDFVVYALFPRDERSIDTYTGPLYAAWHPDSIFQQHPNPDEYKIVSVKILKGVRYLWREPGVILDRLDESRSFVFWVDKGHLQISYPLQKCRFAVHDMPRTSSGILPRVHREELMTEFVTLAPSNSTTP